MEQKQSVLISDAQKAFNYDAKKALGGGYKLTHSPNSYGIALKWLISRQKMTYKQFAERLNGTTGQNLNYFINRVGKSKTEELDFDRMCLILKVSKEYFLDLCNEIEKLMEK